ncbi:hypothetical protein STANM309S_05633 [Streptomyces tanashiensis]
MGHDKHKIQSIPVCGRPPEGDCWPGGLHRNPVLTGPGRTADVMATQGEVK